MGEAAATMRRTWGTTIESVLSGRVTGPMIAQVANEYRKLGGAAIWIIGAEDARSYSPDAVERAVRDFGQLRRDAPGSR